MTNIHPLSKNSNVVEIIELLYNRYHTKLRFDIERATPLFEKVVRAHGGKNENLKKAKSIYDHVTSNLLFHLQKEEQILFPAMRESFQSSKRIVLANPIACMSNDHTQDELSLSCLKSLMKDFVPPIGACNTYKTLISILFEIYTDTLEHMQIENDVLFPQFLV